MWAMIEKFRIRSMPGGGRSMASLTLPVRRWVHGVPPVAFPRPSAACRQWVQEPPPSGGGVDQPGVPVANIKSQKKRILTNAKAAERNRAVRSELKTRVKKAESTVGTDENEAAVRAAVKRLDSAVNKGVIHKNTAARRKSRLMKRINAG